MGVTLGREPCWCTVHQSLGKRLPHKVNGHTLHNLMRVNRAIYNEVEAAMHILVPVLVFLKGPTDGEKDWSGQRPHKLKPTSKILINVSRTQHIILQSALPYSNENDWESDLYEIGAFFDWWDARDKFQAQLPVRLGESTHKADFDALKKLDSWLSARPRDLGNMLYVFDGFEDCGESIRTCVVKLEYIGPGVLDGPSLNNKAIQRVRWFCRQHPTLIGSSIDWAKVEERGKDKHGYEKIKEIYPWT